MLGDLPSDLVESGAHDSSHDHKADEHLDATLGKQNLAANPASKRECGYVALQCVANSAMTLVVCKTCGMQCTNHGTTWLGYNTCGMMVMQPWMQQGIQQSLMLQNCCFILQIYRTCSLCQEEEKGCRQAMHKQVQQEVTR